jgi:hypothetical protein
VVAELWKGGVAANRVERGGVVSIDDEYAVAVLVEGGVDVAEFDGGFAAAVSVED